VEGNGDEVRPEGGAIAAPQSVVEIYGLTDTEVHIVEGAA